MTLGRPRVSSASPASPNVNPGSDGFLVLRAGTYVAELKIPHFPLARAAGSCPGIWSCRIAFPHGFQ